MELIDTSKDINKQPEELTFTDIHSKLFQIETLFKNDEANIDLALQKLDLNRKETSKKLA